MDATDSIKNSERLDREMGTAAARELAQRFGSDTKAADYGPFGRRAGFTNRKSKYSEAATGLILKIVEATGEVYSAADEFIRGVQASLEGALAFADQILEASEEILTRAHALLSVSSNAVLK